ncbi:MAG: hypothetical protein PUP93_14445 [Rhizonema sp. NSF051]|nr:hypothetical protein [Rhizonema sp. NSF051]
MQAPRIYNLGEIIVGDSLISDAPLSKEALSQILLTSRPTIKRYDEVCYWEIEDYRQQYPELPREQWLIKKQKRDRTVPLSPYQIWIISGIQICFKHYRKEQPVRNYIKEHQYIFCHSTYEKRLVQLAKAATAA